jgi:hypothetical protein
LLFGVHFAAKGFPLDVIGLECCRFAMEQGQNEKTPGGEARRF